jgi:hypothetical protein
LLEQLCCFNIHLIKEYKMFNLFSKSAKDTVKTEVITYPFPKAEEAIAGKPETFQDIRRNWKALAEKKAISSSDMAALCVYRSLVKGQGKEGAIGRLQKAFGPITNPVKLANGMEAHMSVKSSLRGIPYSTFAGWLTKDELKAVTTMAQEIAKEWK